MRGSFHLRPNPKRHYSEEQEELKCSICFVLVIDAVQVICCGTLFCRACICKCATWSLCRKPFSIIPDVRCERLSAAAVRQCSWCSFKGNRASVADHEARECHLVPVGVMRKKTCRFRGSFQKTARDAASTHAVCFGARTCIASNANSS